jgi:hypothetical protein
MHMGTALRDPVVQTNLLEILLLGACMKFASIFVSPHLKSQFDLPIQTIGFLFAFAGFLNSIFQGIVGKHMDKGVSDTIIEFNHHFTVNGH